MQNVKVIEMSMEKAKEEAAPVTKSDIEYLERRMERAYQDREKLRKMIRIVIGILVDKKLVGEQLAKTFMESREVDLDKLLEFLEKNK